MLLKYGMPLLLALLPCLHSQQTLYASPGSTIDASSLSLKYNNLLRIADQAAGNASSSNSANSSSTASPTKQAQAAYTHDNHQTTAQGQVTTTTSMRSNINSSSSAGSPPLPANDSSSTSQGSGSCLDDASQNGCGVSAVSTRNASATNDELKTVCSSKAYLSGCSVYRVCTQGIDPASVGKTPNTCDSFTLLATICGLDSLAADEKGCSGYRSMCLSHQTAMQQCNSSQGLQHLVPTAAARQLSRIICDGPRSADTCKRCDWSQAAPLCDFLSVYGALCVASPDMNECSVWQKMCTVDPSLYVCRQQLPGGQPGPAGSGPQTNSVAAAPPAVWATSSALIRTSAQALAAAVLGVLVILL